MNDQLRATTSEKSTVLCSFIPGQSYNVKVSAYSVMGEGPKASLDITVNALSKSSIDVNLSCLVGRADSLVFTMMDLVGGDTVMMRRH